MLSSLTQNWSLSEKITVDDDEDEGEEKLEKVQKIYREFMNKDLRGKAMPKKNEDGFYRCSAAGKKRFLLILRNSKILSQIGIICQISLLKRTNTDMLVYMLYTMIYLTKTVMYGSSGLLKYKNAMKFIVSGNLLKILYK